MGNTTFTKRQRFPILISGLEGVGKTTIAFRLSLNKTVTTVPTVSFESVSVKSTLYKFDVQDLGGQTMLYHLWSLYYKNSTGIVYVVDSSRGDLAMRASVRLLKDMLSHADLNGLPLLVLVNKQDLEWSKSTKEIADMLNIESIRRNRPVHICGCCGITGEGLSDAFRWLYESIYIKYISDGSWVTKRLSPRAMRRLSSSRRSFRGDDDFVNEKI